MHSPPATRRVFLGIGYLAIRHFAPSPLSVSLGGGKLVDSELLLRMRKTPMKTYMAKKGELEQKWLLVDATDKIVGRLASEIAVILMGKHRPTYTPHVDTGDYVVVVNAEKIKFSGNKWEQKTYAWYTGYPRQRTITAEALPKPPKHPQSALLAATSVSVRSPCQAKLYSGEPWASAHGFSKTYRAAHAARSPSSLNRFCT